MIGAPSSQQTSAAQTRAPVRVARKRREKVNVQIQSLIYSVLQVENLSRRSERIANASGPPENGHRLGSVPVALYVKVSLEAFNFPVAITNTSVWVCFTRYNLLSSKVLCLRWA